MYMYMYHYMLKIRSHHCIAYNLGVEPPVLPPPPPSTSYYYKLWWVYIEGTTCTWLWMHQEV